ncbi:MAG: GNAT family N-acetyltransferase [Halobacteriales archaeon]
MSSTVELHVVRAGEDDFLEAAWELKERIRRVEGVLKQRRGFFSRAYRRATVYVAVDLAGRLLGFAAARRDGYLLFLAVDPDHRGIGLGHRLVAAVSADHDRITCHARCTNEAALGFYEHLGFEVVRRIANYYEDGGDAYLLRLGDPPRLADRLREFIPT